MNPAERMNRAERRRAERLHLIPSRRPMAPMAELDGYRDLQVVVPNPDVSDEDLAEEVDRKRWEYCELVSVSGRAAETGDIVTLKIEGSRDGEPVDELSSPAYSCELGNAVLGEIFDSHILGLEIDETANLRPSRCDPP